MITRTLSQEIKEVGLNTNKHIKFITVSTKEELNNFILKSKLLGLDIREFVYRDTQGTSGMVLGDTLKCSIIENSSNIYFVSDRKFRSAGGQVFLVISSNSI